MRRAGQSVLLGARLLAAAQLVRRGVPVADIGCDHGKLAAFLALRGAPRVIAVDNRPGPLARARALAAQEELNGKMDCRLGDGLAVLEKGEADDIVVAGLSGQSIAEILAPHGWVQSPAVRLVLVPTTRHAVLRRWLLENGYELLAERAVLENKRAYAVMSAAYTGRSQAPDEFFCQTGLLPNDPAQDAAAVDAYLNARLAMLEKEARGPMDPAKRAAHEKLRSEVRACLR